MVVEEEVKFMVLVLEKLPVLLRADAAAADADDDGVTKREPDLRGRKGAGVAAPWNLHPIRAASKSHAPKR